MHLNACLGASGADVRRRSLAGGTLLAAATLLGRAAAVAPSSPASGSPLRDYGGTEMWLW